MKRNPFFAVAILLTMIVGCTERNPTYTDIGGIVKKDLGRRDGTIKKDRGTVKKDKGTVKKAVSDAISQIKKDLESVEKEVKK